LQRGEEIGRYVQGRLVALVSHGAPERVRDPVELQFLVQAMGPLQTQSPAPYNAAFDKIEGLVNHWKEGDQTIVATAINTYVAMWPHARAPQAPEILCGILRDRDIALLGAKVAAAEGLGRLQYAAALPVLMETAADKEELLNVRVAAIESLGKMPQEGKDVDRVRVLLRGLLQRRDPRNREAADVIGAALRAFAHVGAVEEANVIFPWMLDHEQNIPGIAATSVMIDRSPVEAPRIVRAFLEWIVDQEIPENLNQQPDEAITNMAHYSPEQANQARDEIKNAARKALVGLRKDHPNERVRRRADTILRDMDRLQGAIGTTATAKP
jgi:hypothetical protein